jgi:transcriptional regulator with XRE-family HTH domain
MLNGMTAHTERWGAEIRRLRTERGWTILELARRADSQPAHISRIERGINAPSDELRMRVAAALGVRVEQIFTYPDTTKAAS